MMKFKNTLIIFLGIIAIIFAGCKEKKATHESGIIAEPQKSETYEENGISYKKEKYLSYEITYPVLNKNIKDKSFVQYIDYQCYWCGYNRPTSDPSDSYKGEPYDLQIYHKEWELPADIEKQNISEITYTVYNKPGTFVNEYQQAKIVRQAQSNGG